MPAYSAIESILPVAMSHLPPNRTIRPPMFAGELYPADALTLQAQVDAALSDANATPEKPLIPYVRTLLVPYGHYAHVLPTLAEGYRHVESARYELVVFIAPTVDTYNRLMISGYGYFGTPLGEIELSDYVRNELCDEDDDFFISELGLPKGSSIEVQLPLLQRTIGKHHTLRIVPLLVGNQTIDLCNEAATALSEILTSKNALVVAVNNFHLSTENTPLVEEFMAGMREHDYGALIRMAVMHDGKLGSGLGAWAIAARVSHSLGARNFHLLAQRSNVEAGAQFISACYTQQ
ncbi:MAG: AmmeMemoRadiSam system protein B [Chloroherpetonaceae bacterium]